MGAKDSKPVTDPDELIRQMEENPDVVVRYYDSNQHLVVQYIEENFWEEDVEEWLIKIRQRSPSEVLKVRKLDYLKPENAKTNNTPMYENSALVVRRASSFKFSIYLGTRPFNVERDDMAICFGLGPKPDETSGTKIVCNVSNKAGPKDRWSCCIAESSGTDSKVLTVQVQVPPNAIVARYALSVEITSGTKEGRKKSIFRGKSVIVLFNPFSPDDDVYMADKNQREEYVLNDTGLIYRGAVRNNKPTYISGKQWDFAQFDQGVLDNVLLMLLNDSRHLRQPLKCWKKRSSPVYVSRVLCAMVNSADDKGVLTGRWDGEYGDGVSPGTWSGSEPILRKWKEGGMVPVKYGQCWVFSGILTTVLRALGIPARSVTNFDSAHDTDANVTIDMYYDANTGMKMDETSDSVWNFHVWNEAYFKRPDLVEGYDGWQAVDATPQEVSEVVDAKFRGASLYQCGPAPVKAIQEGNINIGYDANFIFGEVNADRVQWLVRDDKIVGQGRRFVSNVGRFISTKAVMTNERDDVTLEYKYKEGSDAERSAFRKAYGRGTRDHSSGGYFEGDGSLMEPKFQIEIADMGEVSVGSDIVATVEMKNVSKNVCKTNLKMIASSKRHIGTVHAVLKRTTQTVDIDPGKVFKTTFTVALEDYTGKIVDNKVINIRVVATDTADGNTVVEEEDVELVIPNCISIKTPDSLDREKENEIEVVITNKLPSTMTKGVLALFPRGTWQKHQTIKLEKPIRSGESHAEKFLLTPRDQRRIVSGSVTFTSQDVSDMQSSFNIKVA